ncbi:MAG: hypothetical protein H0W61_17010, partial [Bacteroidetes bacterium]|nr:hypothetical protein [Bacteroidota bacterium]
MAAKKKTAKKAVVKKIAKKSKAKSKPMPAKKTKKAAPKKSLKPAPLKEAIKVVKFKPVKKVIAPKVIKEKKVLVNAESKETIDNVQPSKRTRKSSKKPVFTLPAPPRIEVSNLPKNKVKTILVSQPKPVDTDKNPYFDLARKHNLNVHFRQFIRVE